MRLFISTSFAALMIVLSAGSIAAGLFTFLAVWVFMSTNENKARISTERRYRMRETARRNRG